MHEIGHIRLPVAVLAHVQVEHELNERAMQLREMPGHDHESGTRDPRWPPRNPSRAARRPPRDLWGRTRIRAACPSAEPRRCRPRRAPSGTLAMKDIGYPQLQLETPRPGSVSSSPRAWTAWRTATPRAPAGAPHPALRFCLPRRLGVGVALRAQPIGLDLSSPCAAPRAPRLSFDIQHKSAPRQFGGHFR